MGTVWLCLEETLQRLVAVEQIDVVAGESADDPSASAQVTYTRADGSRGTEEQTLYLQPDDGGYLIAADR